MTGVEPERNALRLDTAHQDAFDALWQEYRPRIWRLVARLSGCVDSADDLTQEVSLRALQAFPDFRRKSSAFTWLYRIAVNVVLRHRELQSPFSLPLDTAPAITLAAHKSSEPTPAALQEELRCVVQKALDHLPEDLRVSLILHTYEQMKYREIAEVLGIPIGTVMSRIYHARQRLQEELKDYVQDTL